MKRPFRILLEVLGPPAVATIIFLGLFSYSRRDAGALRDAPLLAGIAYLYAICPSIIYAVIMEIAFSRWVSPSSLKAVALSTVLGGVSGFAIICSINPHQVTGEGILTMAGIGIVVGLVLGLIIMRSSRPLDAAQI